MDLRGLDALLARARCAHETACDLVESSRSLRSRCMEARLERADARHSLGVAGVATGRCADGPPQATPRVAGVQPALAP